MDSTVKAPQDDLKSKEVPQSSADTKEETKKPETNESENTQSSKDNQETLETPQPIAEKNEDAKKTDENNLMDIPELKPMAVEEKKDNGETPSKKRSRKESENPDTEKQSPNTSSPKKKPKLVIVKSYGFGDSGVICEVCFTEENLDMKEDGPKCPVVIDPLIKCIKCGLLTHSDCYFPKNSIDDEGFFECDACEAIKKGEGPVEGTEMTPEKKKRHRRSTIPMSPGPLPPESEAKDDGRLHPRIGDSLDMYCQLCLRRDVVGGMKPTDTGTWVHLSCTMSTIDVFRKDGLMRGVDKALERSRKQVKAVERSGITVTCEACGRPGGYLIQCAHKPEKKNKQLSEPRCQRFLHPLCAELADRDRVIKTVYTGDTIFFKCAIHTFGEDRCVLCNQADRQNEMLECDGCEKGYHMSCLYPPLEKVPDGDWFCDNCKRKNKDGEGEAQNIKAKENDTKDDKVAKEEKKSQPSVEEEKKGEGEDKLEESQEKKEADVKKKDVEKQETDSKEKKKKSAK